MKTQAAFHARSGRPLRTDNRAYRLGTPASRGLAPAAAAVRLRAVGAQLAVACTDWLAGRFR
jgi:hypothetical protein